ncbi:GH36 C-terminal domain-containing protein [Nguyenibacter vanlangensis]|uniref:GH36 C-terminal domain-containing protein n=1 Tax=Nguyenibacter vanlangensis TaxID=1216886 RepID=A0A7Y7IUC1_9PROT|nr:GH36 C-terminal domain-containing protein [Nguyenibacter vanlangensis]NVN10228.1 GH36 C-terminal domain-containing protein [Nguyenibacter vanlangensis]
MSEDRRHAVYLLVQDTTSAAQYPAPTRLPGLDPGCGYRLGAPAPNGMPSAMDLPLTAAQRAIAEGRLHMAGALLMSQIGIVMPNLWPQSAVVLECRAL